MVCVCGAGNGGSRACGMLGMIRSFISYADADRMSPEDRKWVEEMRKFI